MRSAAASHGGERPRTSSNGGTTGRKRVRATLLFEVGLALIAVVVGAYFAGILDRAELATVDGRFSVRGTSAPPADLVVVAIDDVTFDLDIQWPFPRSMHAEVIDRIIADGARAVAFDIEISEPSGDDEKSIREDNALIEAVERGNGKVVMAATEVDAQGRTGILGGDELLREIGARAGNAVIPSDSGGVIRRVWFKLEKLETFAVATVEQATGRQVDGSDFPASGAWIDFAGPPGTLRTVSYSHVLSGAFPRGLFKGRIAVVGASAPNLQDLHTVSTSGESKMSGPEIQASAISTIMRGLPLRSVPRPLDIAMMILLGLVAPLASLKLRPLRAFGVAVIAGATYVAVAQLAFQAGWVVLLVYPLLALALTSVGSLAVHYLVATFERQRVHDLFARFVPEAVVNDVVARADDGIRLGGVEAYGTIMFTDLRGFTTFSEKLPAPEVIDLLNRYLTEMSDAILANGGTILSYLGDGIMAAFGAPIEDERHADKALACAREMIGERLPRFNETMLAEGYPQGFKMGVGLLSGPFMSGTVGSERRVEYTAIGDTCNTASRIEGLTKGTPFMILLADSTREALHDVPDDLVFVDELPIRGRSTTVKLWSLESLADREALSAATASGAVALPATG
jgi:adenylate cyclase